MAALDDPKALTFVREGKASDGSDEINAMAEWHDVLTGPAFLRYLERTGIASGNRARDVWRKRKEGGMRPGIVMGSASGSTDA